MNRQSLCPGAICAIFLLVLAFGGNCAGQNMPGWMLKVAPLPEPTGRVIRVKDVEELLRALDQLLPESTILVAEGEYSLPHPLVLSGKTNIAIRGASGDAAKVTLRGKGWENGDEHDDILHIGRCEGVTVADLTFADCRSYGVKVEAENGPRDIHIRNCRFRNIGVRAIKGSAGQDPDVRAVKGEIRGCDFENTRLPPANWLFQGDYISAIDMMALEDWTISDNVFRNIKGRNGGGRAAIFIWVRSRNIVVERNLIVNCDRGVAFGNPGQSMANQAGERLVYVADSLIRNNFIAGGADCGIELWHVDGIKVLNNSIWRPEQNWSRGIRIGTGTTRTMIVNNLVHGQIPLEGGEAEVRNNLAARLENYFAAPSAGDLRLTASATGAIGKGVSLPDVREDIRGHARAADPDLGAWETDKRRSQSDTTIQLNLTNVYYTLPRWSVGAKMTAYGSDFAAGDYPSDRQRAKRTTPDGKNWLTCIQEMKLGFIGASMVSQGRPPSKGKPDPHYDDWRVAAGAVVASGGGLMLEYMAGVGPPPGMPGGTTNAPELATNVDPDPGAWSVQNCVDWADYMTSLYGPEKLRLAEFYNEPATMSDLQMGSYSGTYWYSSKLFKRYDRLCADWASNHQQDYYKALKAKYPNVVVCGGSYSDPAGRYNAGEARRYLSGYPGARISTNNPNTVYQDALSLHCYGFQSGSNAFNTPGAPAGGVQAVFNSIFYPALEKPGLVSGYRAGVEQWLGFLRQLKHGSSNKLVNSEWWAYSPEPHGRWYPAGGKEGSHQATADVLGWIVHCQNADRWQFDSIQYHAVNVCSGRNPDAAGRPTEINLPDAYFCEHAGKLWRLGRYYAVKDICAQFANKYRRLVQCGVEGPASPPSPRNNSPGTQIQACAGLNDNGSGLAICLANIGDTPHVITVRLGTRARELPGSVQVPEELGPETPLLPVRDLAFANGSRGSISFTLRGYCAALLEVNIGK